MGTGYAVRGLYSSQWPRLTFSHRLLHHGSSSTLPPPSPSQLNLHCNYIRDRGAAALAQAANCKLVRVRCSPPNALLV